MTKALQGNALSFAIGAVGGKGSLSPAASATRTVTVEFPAKGLYTLAAKLAYRVGVSVLEAGPQTLTVGVDEIVPGNDAGSVASGDGGSSTGARDGGPGGAASESSCGCQAGAAATPSLLALLSLLALRRRPGRGAAGG